MPYPALVTDKKEMLTYITKEEDFDNGKNDYYFPGELCLRVGDFVKVPTEVGESNAIVIHIQAYSESEVPKPINETEQIIEKMF